MFDLAWIAVLTVAIVSILAAVRMGELAAQVIERVFGGDDGD